MSVRPTVSKAMVRRKIRTALKLRRAKGLTEELLLETVSELCGGGVGLQQLRDELEYNHAEAFIRSAHDKEADETHWIITPKGNDEDI